MLAAERHGYYMKDDRRNEEIEYMDLEEEDKDTEADDWQEDDWEDEPEPMKPWTMVLIFLGLLILAAILCAILWRFTHGDDKQDADNEATQPPVVAEGPTSAPEEQTPLPAEEPTATPDEQQSPDASETPTADTTAAPTPADDLGEPTDGDVSMSFNAVQESVTPKDIINLRSVPSTADENTVVVQVSNGEVLNRTGMNPDTGWSRIDYNGQTLYAVTQYLTTDLTYKPPVQAANPNRITTISGRVIIFTDCDDQLTPKEYVNLRTEPSTTEGDTTVRCQVQSGEVVHRTGYSADSGWSRVEYNGEVLYVVTSLMQAQ